MIEIQTAAELRERAKAVAAIGRVVFSRVSPGAPILIPAGTVVAATSGQQFVTTTEPLLLGLEIDADIQAAIAGPNGNVAAGTITSLQASLGAITVSNPEPTVGGSEAETDDEYRERVFAFFPSLRRGTAFALQTGALSVAGVSSATVDDLVYPPTVYIADSAGGSNDALIAAVVAELVHWRAAGVPVNVIGATAVAQAVVATLLFETGFDTVANRTAIAAAIATAINSLDTGETLYRSSIVRAAGRAVDGLLDIAIATPAADVTPAPHELLRSEPSLVTLG